MGDVPNESGGCPEGRLGGSPRQSSTTVIIVILVLAIGVALAWPMFRRAARGSVDRIDWRVDLPTSLAEAKTLKKAVVLDFTASWCGPCQNMARDSWPDDRVQQVMRAHYLAVRLDEAAPGVHALEKQYQVEGYPTLIIVDDEGKEIRRSLGQLEADQLKAFLGGP